MALLKPPPPVARTTAVTFLLATVVLQAKFEQRSCSPARVTAPQFPAITRNRFDRRRSDCIRPLDRASAPIAVLNALVAWLFLPHVRAESRYWWPHPLLMHGALPQSFAKCRRVPSKIGSLRASYLCIGLALALTVLSAMFWNGVVVTGGYFWVTNTDSVSED